MNNSMVIINSFISNTLKSKFEKKNNKKISRQVYFILLNSILFNLPLISFLLFKRERIISLGESSIVLKIIFYYNIILLLFTHFKDIINNLFLSEDFEVYLSYPIKLRDVFIGKLLKLFIEIGISSPVMLIPLIFYGTILNKQRIFYVQCIITMYLMIITFITLVYMFSLIIQLFYQLITNFTEKKVIIIGSMSFLILGFLLKLKNIEIFIDEFFLVNKFIEILNFKRLMENCKLIFILLTIILVYLCTFKLYKYIIFNRNVNKKFKRKSIRIKDNNVVISLIRKDVIKILRNPSNRFNIIFGAIILPIIFLVLFMILLYDIRDSKKLEYNVSIIVVIFTHILCICNTISSTAISREGVDLGFLGGFPLKKREFMSSKVMTSIIFNIPNVTVLIFLSIFFFNNSSKLLIVNIISILFNTLTFIIMGIYLDGKKPNLLWLNSSDLYEDYEKVFKLISYSIISTLPLYILSMIFKQFSLLIYMSIQGIIVWYFISFSKKLNKVVNELTYIS